MEEKKYNVIRAGQTSNVYQEIEKASEERERKRLQGQEVDRKMKEAEERGRQRATQPATFFGRVAKRGSDYVLGSGEGRKKKSGGLTGFLGGLAKNAGESTGFYGARKKRASYSGYDMWNAGGITGGLEWDDPFVEAGPRSRRRRRKGRRR